MTLKIEFIKSQNSFRGDKKPLNEEQLFDTSYNGSRSAIGKLRFPGVGNAQYKSKHPIFNANGDNVGFLIRGMETLGYTYNCIYVDKAECFYLTHSPVGSPAYASSYISIVSDSGGFLFGKGIKFERTQSFELPDASSNILAFKLIEDQRYLLVIAKRGFCLIDAIYRKLVSKTSFNRMSYSMSLSGFALSPKVKLLAVAFSIDDYKDPLDGEYKYQNFIHIYDLETGNSIGNHSLDTDKCSNWKLAFSTDGRQLSVSFESCDLVFDLDARR